MVGLVGNYHELNEQSGHVHNVPVPLPCKYMGKTLPELSLLMPYKFCRSEVQDEKNITNAHFVAQFT